MKKRFKKFMALAMAGAMICSSMTAFATDYTAEVSSNVSGEGKLEGWVEKEVFKVQLPTTPISDEAYKFVLDPQGLITATSGEAYKDVVSENAISASADGLYFTNYNASGNATAMSEESDSMMAVNKGTVPVNLSLSAKVTGLSTVGLSETREDLTSGDAAKTNIYLAIKASGDGVSGNAETAITSDGGSTSFVLDAASGDAYEIKYDSSGNAYSYDLTDTAASADAATSALFSKLEFNLTGSCNQADDVDWKSVKDVTPVVEVVWTLKNANDTSTGYLDKTSISASSNTVTLTMPEGVNLTNLVVKYADTTKADYKLYGTKLATATMNGKIIATVTFAAAVTNEHGSKVEVTYSDGKTDLITIE